MAKIGHSQSIRTTLVRKYWKSCKTVKIGHSKSIWTTLVGKYWKSCKMAKLAILNQFGPLQQENIGKVAKQHAH